MKLPAKSGKPWLLVDIDGVVSLYGFTPDRRPAGTWASIDGIAHYLSADAGGYLHELSAHYALAWCSGWEERANEYLPHLLGLPAPLPFVSFDRRPGHSGSHWKLAAVDAAVDRGAAVAWVDDAFDERCHAWAAQRPAPTLLVATEPPTGLRREQVDELLAWAQQLRPAARPPG